MLVIFRCPLSTGWRSCTGTCASVSMGPDSKTRPPAAQFRRFAAFVAFGQNRSIRSRYGYERRSLPIAPMDMDCITLAWLWAVGCDADRSHHACRGHASRLGQAVYDNDNFMAAVGFGHFPRASSWPSNPTGRTKAGFQMVLTR